MTNKHNKGPFRLIFSHTSSLTYYNVNVDQYYIYLDAIFHSTLFFYITRRALYFVERGNRSQAVSLLGLSM